MVFVIIEHGDEGDVGDGAGRRGCDEDGDVGDASSRSSEVDDVERESDDAMFSLSPLKGLEAAKTELTAKYALQSVAMEMVFLLLNVLRAS